MYRKQKKKNVNWGLVKKYKQKYRTLNKNIELKGN